MPNLKVYNTSTEAWEYLVVGKQGPTGPQGPSGVVSVTAPITNTGTSSSANIGINLSFAQDIEVKVLMGAI
jgi:hypothetical protein